MSLFVRLGLFCLFLMCSVFKSIIYSDPATPAAGTPAFLAVTVATSDNDAYRRYLRSAHEQAIPVRVVGMGEQWLGGNEQQRGERMAGAHKIVLLRHALEPYKERDDLIIMFTDCYNVVFVNSGQEIVRRFKELDSDIVFSADNLLWPDTSLEQKYPSVTQHEIKYLNSGGFVGFAPKIYRMLTQYGAVQSSDDDQLYYTRIFLDLKARADLGIKLDTRAQIFQNLNGAFDDVTVNHHEAQGYLYNARTKSIPIVINGNGPIKSQFNSLSNYLGKNWDPINGCKQCKENRINLEKIKPEKYPKVTAAIFITLATPFIDRFFERIEALTYPKARMDLIIYCAQAHHLNVVKKFRLLHGEKYATFKLFTKDDFDREVAAKNGILSMTTNTSDFYVMIDSIAHITKSYVIQQLVSQNRSIVAPLLKRRGHVWSNFWGAVSDNNYYARSEDYAALVSMERRGLWNMPFINNFYAVQSRWIPQMTRVYGGNTDETDGDEADADIEFAKNCRHANIFMYVDNREQFGYLTVADETSTEHMHNDLWEIFQNPVDWRETYIHENYSLAAAPETQINQFDQPCLDVFRWPLFSKKFARQIIEEMEYFNQWSGGKNNDKRLEGGYENVPTWDIHMTQCKWDEHFQEILRTYVYPLQIKLFPGHTDKPWARLNFIVRYRANEQPFLRPHHDSSSYTLNIALNTRGVDFEGGGARFIRYNCTIHDTEIGHALMHPGRVTHYHEGLRTTWGTRYIFVTFINP